MSFSLRSADRSRWRSNAKAREENELRESEARLRVLIEQLPAVLWTVDKNLRFTSAVGAGLARLGLKPNQIVGMSLSEYFETTDQSFTPIAAHLRAIGGEPVTFPVEWKNGSTPATWSRCATAAGEVHGAICMALDVTDRKQLEEQFRQAQKMEAVGRLAGGIAHDFNNLLMVIQGYADLLADRLPAGESAASKRGADSDRGAARGGAHAAIAGLQPQADPGAEGARRSQRRRGHGKDAAAADRRRYRARDVLRSAGPLAGEGRPQPDRASDHESGRQCAGRDAQGRPPDDRNRQRGIRRDPFSHSPTVLAPGKYVMLAVTDNGCGMDAKTQAHIFEPFFTTKEKGKGTGLGLATVYGIVKQSGGYIWVYSEPGHGTTFKIYLPHVQGAGAVPGAIAPARIQESPRGSEVVLLVEDETGVRELAREYLEMSGYTVLVARDGHAAIELAAMHSGPIHLLMTDVVMPGIGGRGAGPERDREARPEIKILYMSGYTDQAVVHQGILGTDAILLQKPFTLATLASKLREILAAETVQ